MTDAWEPYKNLLGLEVVQQLFQIAATLKGAKIVHVNSTRVGGGVAEILNKMVPLMTGLGLNASWEIVEGNEPFYQCTKTFHNLFQGTGDTLPSAELLRNYEEVNKKNSEKLTSLKDADFVMIHDPQPLALIKHFPDRKGKWIWRCHIDTSQAPRSIWRYCRPFIDQFNASVFSLENFDQPLPHPVYIIAPSIDPFSEKNIELDSEEVQNTIKSFNINVKKPLIVQISRFDSFKDPKGVIKAFQLSKKYHPGIQLVLAGGGATDDPESDFVLKESIAAAQGDPDIHILNLPPDAPRVINALQRGADIVLQKSTKEGFGLTVTEALWKMKPVIAGNTGGIRIQVMNHYTGFLVNTPEGAANRMRYLLQNPDIGKECGIAGKKLVKENFLITRHLREYLSMFTTLMNATEDRIYLHQSS
jgi:trehalose synthase